MSSQVKGRNEPINVLQVCEVIAGVKNISMEEAANVIFQTTEDIYFCNH